MAYNHILHFHILHKNIGKRKEETMLVTMYKDDALIQEKYRVFATYIIVKIFLVDMKRLQPSSLFACIVYKKIGKRKEEKEV